MSGIPIGTALTRFVVQGLGVIPTIAGMGVLYLAVTLSMFIRPALRQMDVPSTGDTAKTTYALDWAASSTCPHEALGLATERRAFDARLAAPLGKTLARHGASVHEATKVRPGIEVPRCARVAASALRGWRPVRRGVAALRPRLALWRALWERRRPSRAALRRRRRASRR
jgi:hypothetical protein